MRPILCGSSEDQVHCKDGKNHVNPHWFALVGWPALAVHPLASWKAQGDKAFFFLFLNILEPWQRNVHKVKANALRRFQIYVTFSHVKQRFVDLNISIVSSCFFSCFCPVSRKRSPGGNSFSSFSLLRVEPNSDAQPWRGRFDAVSDSATWIWVQSALCISSYVTASALRLMEEIRLSSWNM